MELMAKIAAATLISIAAIAGVAGIAFLMAFPVKWTWNVTMPYLFSLPTLTWGKAWCLQFLCGCLIKSTHTHSKG